MENGTPETLQEAVVFYSDVENCIQLMIKLRWADGVTCPHCQSKKVTRIKMQARWQCNNKDCRKQFTAKVGTIMEDSALGLDKWFMAIWMLTNCKNGISSYEIHRALGIQQKSAWFMLHRIRFALANGTFEKLGGEVEADETYIGGKETNRHASKRLNAGRGIAGKVVVAGLLERGGGVRIKTVPNTGTPALHGHIKTNVEPGTIIYTDAHRSYNGLSPEYKHGVVDHAIEYVRDRIHTNGMENFWSLLKRAIKGTYISIDVPHLDAYLAEQSYRFNYRKSNDTGRFLLATASTNGKRLTYKELTGRGAI